MLTILLLRTGEQHVVSYRQPNGSYRTLCGKVVAKSTLMNTLSADATYSGLCDICKKHADSSYEDDLNDYTAMVRNQSTAHLPRRLEYNRSGIEGPQMDHYGVESRDWHTLNKYKKLIPKAKVKVKKKKKKKYKDYKFK